MAEKIGYRNPPKRTRFKKGQSGNPAGRPKKSKNFMTLLADELDEQVTVNEDGRKRKISKLEAMVKRIVSGALQGDRKSMLTLIDIFRRTERFSENEGTDEDWLPEDYDKIVDQYVQRQQKKPKLKKDKS